MAGLSALEGDRGPGWLGWHYRCRRLDRWTDRYSRGGVCVCGHRHGRYGGGRGVTQPFFCYQLRGRRRQSVFEELPDRGLDVDQVLCQDVIIREFDTAVDVVDATRSLFADALDVAFVAARWRCRQCCFFSAPSCEMTFSNARFDDGLTGWEQKKRARGYKKKQKSNAVEEKKAMYVVRRLGPLQRPQNTI